MASNSGDSSGSALKSSLNGSSLLTASLLHRLPYRSPLYGPSRKQCFQQFLYCYICIRCHGNMCGYRAFTVASCAKR
jgi:hypothetical protein